MENPERITYRQLWESVFEGYEPEKNRLKKLVNSDSEYNKRITKYLDCCKKLSPDMDEELKKLGFNKRLTKVNPDYCTPGSEDFYYNDREDVISISEEGIMVATFNGEAKSFKSDIVGEKHRLAIEWIKEKVKNS